MSLTSALLDPILRAAPARPLITFYDDATGERIELSAVTTANWVAKAANLLRDECDVEPGGRVAVLLPAHWQTASVLLAAWSCGAEVVGEPAEADWVLCDRDRLDLALAAAPSGGVLALSLDAFGRGIDGLPDGVIDFATEVRLHGDEFVPWSPVPLSDPALGGLSADDLLARARARAADLGLDAGSRVLSVKDWSAREDLVDGLLAVLAAGGSLVQVAHPDETRLERKYESERCTTRL
ncbi:TIGR03089 family protein [Pseudonocardia sp. WMMC193]|uniref:TIGR03089 family protein n=1 Tax=Pseudonocardia sp. WMMC193 TaxID=2911965 RepID=UPI001F32F5FE|nr:TIGR03089 family protein [Pseudonocardia sp. WMMC193]MCF7553290.1 TIGR03089 family protein [Pseudonocardia sp. WMMC193]